MIITPYISRYSYQKNDRVKPKILPVSGALFSHSSEVSHTLAMIFLFVYTSANSEGSLSLFINQSFNHVKYYKFLGPEILKRLLLDTRILKFKSSVISQ
jgi:hypothetical protein